MVLRTGACCRTVDTASSTLTSGYGDSLARLATSVVDTSPVTQWKILQSVLFCLLFLFLSGGGGGGGGLFVCLFPHAGVALVDQKIIIITDHFHTMQFCTPKLIHDTLYIFCVQFCTPKLTHYTLCIFSVCWPVLVLL